MSSNSDGAIGGLLVVREESGQETVTEWEYLPLESRDFDFQHQVTTDPSIRRAQSTRNWCPQNARIVEDR
jgi:hypothetical protein